MKDKQLIERRKLLKGVNTLAIVCDQWGDTGKGKFVDFFADWADVIARGTGGANAGHTISLNGKEHVFHLVPSGILHDSKGKVNIIGTGTVIDPKVVCDELKILSKEGLTHKNLRISQNAKLVLPQHLVMDQVKEIDASGKIGTTGRGIGPAYVDHYDRIGLVMNDLLNPDSFINKLQRNLRDKIRLLKTFDPKVISDIMHSSRLSNGRFWDSETIFNAEAIMECYLAYSKILGELIRDTDEFLQKSVGKKKILLEGAQGNLLSIDYGTYPFVTSSDCSIRGLTKGVGLKETDVDLTLGIVKAFYMTRVGEGPFLTELGGNESAMWCGSRRANKETELSEYGKLDVNQDDPFMSGVAIRMAGNEYGATTGRPRRTGWLDLPLLRYSMKISGPNTILTKLDVLDQCKQIRICHAYRYFGKDYKIGNCTIRDSQVLKTAIMDDEIIRHCMPLYTDFPGWETPIHEIDSLAKLPANLKRILRFVEKKTGMNTRIISVGKDREQTIVVSG